MLREEIQRLVDTTLPKSRQIIPTFEGVLYLLVGYSIKVFKLGDMSQVTEWKHRCPTVLDVFLTLVNVDILLVETDTQQLGIAQELYSVDIKVLLDVVKKHFLLHLEYLYQKNDVELRTYIKKVLKKPFIPNHKELCREL